MKDYIEEVHSEKFLERSQWYRDVGIRDLQLRGLSKLLEYAKRNCPYYRNLPDVHSLRDIKDLPILTKSKIHDHFNDILVPERPHNVGTTGGTVSAVTLAVDKVSRNLGEKRFESWHDGRGPRVAFLWGSIEAGTRPQIDGNRLWLPIEGLKDQTSANHYLNLIRKFEPTYMRGYSLPLAMLAKYSQDVSAPEILGKVGVIASHCETLLPKSRKLIENSFGCDVYNFYGSRELGSMAQDCPMHKDLHLFAERYIVEVVDGRFLFTDLFGRAFPLIRYENQDVGEFSESCKCGRGLPTIKPLLGRTLHYLKTKKDTWISAFVFYLPILYYDAHNNTNHFGWIEAFHFKQTEPGKVVIYLKPWNSSKPPVSFDKISKIIQKYVDPSEITFEIQITSKIPLSKSGKQISVESSMIREWS